MEDEFAKKLWISSPVYTNLVMESKKLKHFVTFAQKILRQCPLRADKISCSICMKFISGD